MSTSTATDNKRPDDPCLFFCLGTMLGVLITGLVDFMFFVKISKEISPSAVDVEVDSMTVYPSPSYATAGNLSITFSIRNPKYGATFYDDVRVSVFYRDESISSAKIEPFLQVQNYPVFVYTNLTAYKNANPSVAHIMAAEYELHKALTFTATLTARAFLGFTTDDEKQRLISVSCEKIMVGFSAGTANAGTMISSASKGCNVRFSKFAS